MLPFFETCYALFYGENVIHCFGKCCCPVLVLFVMSFCVICHAVCDYLSRLSVLGVVHSYGEINGDTVFPRHIPPLCVLGLKVFLFLEV